MNRPGVGNGEEVSVQKYGATLSGDVPDLIPAKQRDKNFSSNIPPQAQDDLPGLSLCLSVCASVCPSVRRSAHLAAWLAGCLTV